MGHIGEILKDENDHVIVFYSGLGRSGIRQFLQRTTSETPFDFTGMTVRARMVDNLTDLIQQFDIAATVDPDPTTGKFSLDLSAVNMTKGESRILTIYDSAPIDPAVISQVRVHVREPGV